MYGNKVKRRSKNKQMQWATQSRHKKQIANKEIMQQNSARNGHQVLNTILVCTGRPIWYSKAIQYNIAKRIEVIKV